MAWLVVIVVCGGLAAYVQIFGKAAAPKTEAAETVTGVIERAVAPKKAVVAKSAVPPVAVAAPQLFETPAGGIAPAQLSASELAAVAAMAPPASPAPSKPVPVQPVAAAEPVITLPPVAGGPNIANPALLEKTPEGYLPRISDTGIWPLHAYATPVAAGNHPRIAIVIGGLGISAKATSAAITMLPSGVTLAFAPYANDVQRWVSLARQKGHEVLLQVPMEPYDFPDSDPGQYTLRSSVGEEGNIKRLSWSLSRITGYVGVTNLLGARFLSDSGSLEPVLTTLMRRGLMFYDNGAANRSVAKDVAGRLGSPFAQANLTIDSIQASLEIDHRLADLETEARAKGSAAGSGFVYPVTVERVTLWARSLPGRGFVLVPISAIVATEKK
ncbi:MAG: divergent polysaccharide deacetylase family protein [Rhizomicrobium sp.]|nr:divergent polysaccharide deacetylase family protein [Rhizomicrobium sp.]